MKYIGPHVSTAGGVQNAPCNAHAVGATAFGLFTKNQRRWMAKPYESATIDAFHHTMKTCGYTDVQVLAHDSYLINIGNPDKDLRRKSLSALIDEITRCHQLGLTMLNIHPGSHLGRISEDTCCDYIAESINRALNRTNGVTVVLENTAGQGSNVGYRFEHLARIIDSIEDKSRIGCCLDTCHAFAAGYDILTKETYNNTISALDRTVGLNFLRGLHINDAKSAFASNIDRHHSIGDGTIGMHPFRYFLTDPRFDDLPMILETIDETRWPEEIKILTGMAELNE